MEEVIVIPKRVKVVEHGDTKAKYITFPIVFPDNYPGTITLIKGTRKEWDPKKDIKQIIIHYAD